MSTIVTALIGAMLGVFGIWMGFNFHLGTWFIDGLSAYVGAAISGALVALIVRWALRKEFGWP